MIAALGTGTLLVTGWLAFAGCFIRPRCVSLAAAQTKVGGSFVRCDREARDF